MEAPIANLDMIVIIYNDIKNGIRQITYLLKQTLSASKISMCRQEISQ